MFGWRKKKVYLVLSPVLYRLTFMNLIFKARKYVIMHEAKMIDCTVKNVFNSFFFVLCVVAAKRRNTISVVSRVNSQVLKVNKKISIKKKDFFERGQR